MRYKMSFIYFFTIIFTVLFLDFFYYENNENIGNVKHFIYTAEIRNTRKHLKQTFKTRDALRA